MQCLKQVLNLAQQQNFFYQVVDPTFVGTRAADTSLAVSPSFSPSPKSNGAAKAALSLRISKG